MNDKIFQLTGGIVTGMWNTVLLNPDTSVFHVSAQRLHVISRYFWSTQRSAALYTFMVFLQLTKTKTKIVANKNGPKKRKN